MRRDTAGLAKGNWGECCAVTSRAGSLKAANVMPPARESFRSSNATAAMLRSILFPKRSGVIADFGDDAGSGIVTLCDRLLT
jgi:hypothetical protein